MNDPAVSGLRLELLGAPRLLGMVAGAVVALPLDRKLAGALAYLALEGATPRAILAELLWTKPTPDRARQSLRQALQRLHPLTTIFISSDPLRLAGNVAVDVLELRQSLAQGDIGSSDPSGRLLEGLTFDDCPDFLEWLLIERSRLESLRIGALSSEAQRLEGAGKPLAALRIALQQLELDPISESAHRQVMRLHDALGDRAAALRCFKSCVDTLSRELNIAPTEETLILARQIEHGERSTVASSQPALDPLALEVRLVRASKSLEDGNRSEARALALSVLEAGAVGIVAQRAHLIVGQTLILEGRLPEAIPHLEAAAVSSDAQVRLRALMNLGNVASALHGPAEGVALFERALRIAQSLGEATMSGALHNNLAASTTRLGMYAQAQHHLERAEEQLAGNVSSLTLTRVNVVHLSLLRGRLSQALSAAEIALREAERHGSLPLIASAGFAYGLALRRVGDAPAASTSLKRARAIHIELNDARSAAVLEFNLMALETESSSGQLGDDALSTLERLEITCDSALIALCTLELALLSNDPTERVRLANRALSRNQTAQTRMLHAIAHLSAAGQNAQVNLEPLIVNLVNALQPQLHETGLAHATLHAALTGNAAVRALESWRDQFELETRGLTEQQRSGRLMYYTRRSAISSHVLLPRSKPTLTLT